MRRNSWRVSRKSRKIELGFAKAGDGGRDGPKHRVAQLQDSAGGHNNMKISAKAPCRVDMAGGTIDIWPLYLFHTHAVTVNFAVDRYASCELDTRDDGRIVLRSRDLGGDETFDSLEALAAPRSDTSFRCWLTWSATSAPETGLERVHRFRSPGRAPASRDRPR